ncbi:MAG: alpha/beta fold hydrolase [Balneolaceae bacterium]
MRLWCRDIEYYAEVLSSSKGLPWILHLHGFMGSGRAFHNLSNRLKDRFNPVVLDLAGHGRSGGSEDPARYSLREQMDDIRSILERINFRPLVLHGYSMGGRLALHFANEYPDLVDAVVVESSGSGIDDPAMRSHRQAKDEERAVEIESGYDAFLERWLNKPLFRGPSLHSPEWEEYRRIMAGQNPAWMAASLRGFGQGIMPSLIPKPGGRQTPLLLVAGELDVRYRQILITIEQKIPHSRFISIPEAGHRVHLDSPAVLADAITIFTNHLKQNQMS